MERKRKAYDDVIAKIEDQSSDIFMEKLLLIQAITETKMISSEAENFEEMNIAELENLRGRCKKVLIPLRDYRDALGENMSDDVNSCIEVIAGIAKLCEQKLAADQVMNVVSQVIQDPNKFWLHYETLDMQYMDEIRTAHPEHADLIDLRY